MKNDERKTTNKYIILPTNIMNKRGLLNMGNTCYINSLLQCLVTLSEFNLYFQRQQYLKNSIFINNKKVKSNIVQKYLEIYLYLTKGIQINNQEKDISKKKYSAYQLKVALSKQCSLFLDWQQQDAHQFMKKLFDAMHQQLNLSLQKQSYRLLSTKIDGKKSISTLAAQHFQYYKERDNSIIYDIFGGQIYNNLKCIQCKKQSVSFENFLDISLSIIKGLTKIQDLLERFFDQENLGDYYRCQYCNKSNKNSIKNTKLWSLPEILIIHLKRSTSLNNKNLERISFPVHKALDMSSYTYKETQNKNNSSNIKSNRFLRSKYILKGIICHNGSTNTQGHYWSIVKDYGNWYKIDDQKIQILDKVKDLEKKFQIQGSSQPYILFYSSIK